MTRIAVIGNANTAVNYGSYIDTFDVVIRINNGWNIPKELTKHIGTKTTHIKHYVNYFKHFKVNNEITSKIKFETISSRYRNSLRNHFGAVPTSGIMAVYEALKLNPTVLFVTGISFFQQPYRNGLVNNTFKECESARQRVLNKEICHSGEVDYKIFKILYIKNKDIIILDEYLTNLLKNEIE